VGDREFPFEREKGWPSIVGNGRQLREAHLSKKGIRRVKEQRSSREGFISVFKWGQTLTCKREGGEYAQKEIVGTSLHVQEKEHG